MSLLHLPVCEVLLVAICEGSDILPQIDAESLRDLMKLN